MSDDEQRERGYDDGWADAEDFIERHEHGMPWVVARELWKEKPDEGNPYEQGFAEGFQARLKEKGWA